MDKKSRMVGFTLVGLAPLAIAILASILWKPAEGPRWQHMAIVSLAIYAGCKWLSWWTCEGKHASVGRHLGYLFAWPGMNAQAFLQGTKAVPRPGRLEWMFAFAKIGLGFLILALVPHVRPWSDYVAGWVGMVGIVFSLHFGLFHVLSCFWRSLGIEAAPLMNAPILATSVFEFWGRRWNTAFRDLTHRFVFRPIVSKLTPALALAFGFLLSGLVHDVVISIPAQGGYFGPTAFFVIQAIAGFFERSRVGVWLGLAKGWRGWLFTHATLLLPAAWLFHPPFVEGIVLPMLEELGGLSCPSPI